MVEIRFKPGDVGSVADGGIDSMDKFPNGATDPVSPVDKDVFFNTAENKFKRYETDHWVVIDRLEALTQIADDLLTDAKINTAAAISKSKLGALNIVNADVDGGAAIAMNKLTLAITDTEVAVAAGISKDKLAALNIVDADVDAAAAIAKSKLGALNIVDADVDAAAAIAKTKLAPLDIVNADVNAAAAIVKTKLAPLGIVNADVDAAADIVKSKLAALAIVDADISTIGQAKITDLITALVAKVGTGPLSGDKKITAIGWDTATEEVVIDREA